MMIALKMKGKTLLSVCNSDLKKSMMNGAVATAI